MENFYDVRKIYLKFFFFWTRIKVVPINPHLAAVPIHRMTVGIALAARR